MKSFVYLFSIFIFISCSSQRNVQTKDNEISLDDLEEEIVPVYRCTWNDMIENRPSKDLITVPLKLLNVKDNLYNILDSIIDATEKCSKYKDVKLRFLVLVYGFNHKLAISIKNININCFNLTWCTGIFYYKNYPFYYEAETILYDFFEETDEIVEQVCVNPEKVRDIVGDNEGSSWSFFCMDGKLKKFAFNDCGNRWEDENLINE